VSDEDTTTPVDAIVSDVANPELRPLVAVLSNHAIVLEDTKRQVRKIRDRLRVRKDPMPVSELDELGKVFRTESDSAIEVAKVAERLARK